MRPSRCRDEGNAAGTLTIFLGFTVTATCSVFCLKGESTHQWPIPPFLFVAAWSFPIHTQSDALFSWVKPSAPRRKTEGGGWSHLVEIVAHQS
jgi:hypothetical protein